MPRIRRQSHQTSAVILFSSLGPALLCEPANNDSQSNLRFKVQIPRISLCVRQDLRDTDTNKPPPNLTPCWTQKSIPRHNRQEQEQDSDKTRTQPATSTIIHTTSKTELTHRLPPSPAIRAPSFKSIRFPPQHTFYSSFLVCTGCLA